MSAIQGYNIAFKISFAGSYKVLAGRTQDDLTVAARTKERLMKSNSGTPDVIVTGQDVTFRASGLVDASSNTAILRSVLIGMAINGTKPAFRYAVDGDSTYIAGNCVITNISESSNASDDATYTVDFRVDGEVEIVDESDES